MKLLYLPRNKPLENIELVGRLKKLPWAIYRSTKKEASLRKNNEPHFR